MSEASGSRHALTLSGEINARAGLVDSADAGPFVERRAKPRIRQAFPTRVSGLDSDGQGFDFKVGLEDISSGGIYLRIPRTLKIGEQLNLKVQFSNGHPGATATMLGSVLRVEPGLDGLNGIALAIERYEFV